MNQDVSPSNTESKKQKAIIAFVLIGLAMLFAYLLNLEAFSADGVFIIFGIAAFPGGLLFAINPAPVNDNGASGVAAFIFGAGVLWPMYLLIVAGFVFAKNKFSTAFLIGLIILLVINIFGCGNMGL
jgi:inner membrane protein involved in colicin E2 resistance